MKRAAWVSVGVVAMAAWITAGLMSGKRPPARAQTPSPAPTALEIHRVQKAEHIPAIDSGRPLFFLVLGSDARPGQDVDRLHNDSIHLVSINPSRGRATVLGFPRDSWVSLPGRGMAKITDAMVYGGPQLAIQTVEQLTGIDIHYYVLTSFQGLIRMVDAIGGLEIEVEYPMFDDSAHSAFEPGKHTLNGGEALAFARDRHSAPGGDIGRSFNQGRLMVAALRKLRGDFARDPATLFGWVVAGVRNIRTDLPFDEMFDLAVTASQVEKVTNMVVPAGTGSVGGASVVFIGSGAAAVYADMKADGFAESR